jgi:valyl-tRNA synthetase
MIFAGLELMGTEPFHDAVIHSYLQNPEGRRMSRTLGTGIDPEEVLEPYGADATRYGLLKMASSQDPRFSFGSIEEGRKLAIKLWKQPAAAHAAPRSRRRGSRRSGAGSRADHTRHAPVRAGSRRPTSRAIQRLYRLTIRRFCDWCLESIRRRGWRRRTCGRRRSRRSSGCSSSLHPVMPHAAEIWTNLPARIRLIVARTTRDGIRGRPPHSTRRRRRHASTARRPDQISEGLASGLRGGRASPHVGR